MGHTSTLTAAAYGEVAVGRKLRPEPASVGRNHRCRGEPRRARCTASEISIRRDGVFSDVPGCGGQVVLGGPCRTMSSAPKLVGVAVRVGKSICHCRRLASQDTACPRGGRRLPAWTRTPGQGRHWVLGAGSWVLGAGCWVLGAGCWCWCWGAGCSRACEPRVVLKKGAMCMMSDTWQWQGPAPKKSSYVLFCPPPLDFFIIYYYVFLGVS
jgi:hypothetical protein